MKVYDDEGNVLCDVDLSGHSLAELSDVSSTGAQVDAAVAASHTQGTDTSLGTQTQDANWGGYKITNMDRLTLVDGGYIGVASATTAIQVEADGDVVLVKDLTVTGDIIDMVIGTDIQAYDADLATIAAISGIDGDLLYYDSGWSRLPKGANDEVLTMAGGLPSWVAAGGDGDTGLPIMLMGG